MAVFKDKYTASWACKFRYKNWQGEVKQHKKTGFKTQKEAKEYERDYLDKMNQSSDILFKTLAEKYLEDRKPRIKPSSYYSINNLIKDTILDFFGELKVCDISPLIVRTWQNQQKEKGYSEKYLKNMNSQLSSIFKFGISFYGLSSNPVERAGSIGSEKTVNINFWTLEEFNKFIAILKDDMQYETLFYLLFYSGMRIGEALALNYADFDFKENTVRISKTYTKINGKEIILTPKTKKGNRTITLPKFIMNKLQRYRLHQFGMDDRTDRLFPISRNTLNHRFTKWCEKAGVKKIRIHDLRHSHASMLIEKGVQPLMISERLGHENIQTTLQIYSHLYPDKQKQIADMLEECSSF